MFGSQGTAEPPLSQISFCLGSVGCSVGFFLEPFTSWFKAWFRLVLPTHSANYLCYSFIDCTIADESLTTKRSSVIGAAVDKYRTSHVRRLFDPCKR